MKVTLYGGPHDGTTTYVDGEEGKPPPFLDLENDHYILGATDGRCRGDTTFYLHCEPGTPSAGRRGRGEPSAPARSVLVEDVSIPPWSAYAVDLPGDRRQVVIGAVLAGRLRAVCEFDDCWPPE